jgi:hypothetical protein
MRHATPVASTPPLHGFFEAQLARHSTSELVVSERHHASYLARSTGECDEAIDAEGVPRARGEALLEGAQKALVDRVRG